MYSRAAPLQYISHIWDENRKVQIFFQTLGIFSLIFIVVKSENWTLYSWKILVYSARYLCAMTAHFVHTEVVISTYNPDVRIPS